MSTTTETAVAQTTWKLDPTHTVVEFSARHMMITKVRGQFGAVTGLVVVDAADPSSSSVEAEIETTSLTTHSEDRDAHLRTEDFLDVEKYPTIRFRSTKVEGAAREAGDRFEVVGELTIKAVTREVVLDATYEGTGRDPWGGDRISFSADTKIDRRDFGLTWNVALEAGGILVSNEIQIHIEAQAVKEKF